MEKTAAPFTSINRREFIQHSGRVTLSVGLINFLISCSSDDNTVTPVEFTLDLTEPANAALTSVGGAIVKSGIAVIHTAVDEYVALSTRCTHQSCTVTYRANSEEMVCPCHGSRFDNKGDVLQGPATRSLTRYAVSLSGNVLTVNPAVTV